jgi:hypothetical protein
MAAEGAKQFFKNLKFPGGGKGFFGGTGALLGLAGISYGANASLYNGTTFPFISILDCLYLWTLYQFII